MSIRNVTIAVVATAAVVGIGIGVAYAGSDDAYEESESVQVEVAEDATRFAFDESPVFDDGMPAYGNPFVTQGYIYEAGTLAEGGGVNPDGTPTHPDNVIGTWTCEGVMIGDGAHTESGPWVVSTQVFDFGEFDGDDIVISHGFETPEIGEPTDRAVIGGTGEHVGAVGTQSQVLEGFNDGGGVNLTVTLTPAGG